MLPEKGPSAVQPQMPYRPRPGVVRNTHQVALAWHVFEPFDRCELTCEFRSKNVGPLRVVVPEIEEGPLCLGKTPRKKDRIAFRNVSTSKTAG